MATQREIIVRLRAEVADVADEALEQPAKSSAAAAAPTRARFTRNSDRIRGRVGDSTPLRLDKSMRREGTEPKTRARTPAWNATSCG